MFKNKTYEDLLFHLGWHQISMKKWSKKTKDEHNIKIDFGNDEKGFFSGEDKNNKPIPPDILNEFDEIATFRKLQNNLDRGVPL